MSRDWDNACAESCISTIKNELVKRLTFTARDRALLALFRYLEAFYPLRRHSSLDDVGVLAGIVFCSSRSFPRSALAVPSWARD